MVQPKLRFKREDGTEFPEWEEKAIGNYARIYDGVHQTPHYIESGVPFVSVEDIETLDSPTKFISTEDYERDFKTKPHEGDILMTRIGDVGRTAMVPYNGYAYYVSLALIKPFNTVDNIFLCQAMKGEYFQKELWEHTIHTAFPKKINAGDIQNCKIAIPIDTEEQQKIADFLSTVDEVIAQSEAEVQNLEQQKKATMQKIFSREVRFRREDGTEYPEWEEKTIGSYAKIYDGIHQTPNYIESGVPFVSVEDIETLDSPTKFISTEDYERDFKTKPHEGDILMTRIGDVGRTAIVPCDGYAYYVSLALIKPFNTVDNIFLCQAMKGEYFQKELWEHTIHTAFPKKINAGDIQNCKIAIPIDTEEQQKIADFLSVYDESISYAKQEFDKWKELKKGLLQQMFV